MVENLGTYINAFVALCSAAGIIIGALGSLGLVKAKSVRRFNALLDMGVSAADAIKDVPLTMKQIVKDRRVPRVVSEKEFKQN